MVHEEVRKVNKLDNPNANGTENKSSTNGASSSSGIVIVTGVANKVAEDQKRKGELIEQNQDGLEVSIFY